MFEERRIMFNSATSKRKEKHSSAICLIIQFWYHQQFQIERPLLYTSPYLPNVSGILVECVVYDPLSLATDSGYVFFIILYLKNPI